MSEKVCGFVGRSAQDDKRIQKIELREKIKRYQLTALEKKRSRGNLSEALKNFSGRDLFRIFLSQ